MAEFNVYQLLSNENDLTEDFVEPKNQMQCFEKCCIDVKEILDEREKQDTLGQEMTALNRQRDAILGEAKAIIYYKNQIRDIVKEMGISSQWYPNWYSSLEDAVYNEILGFAGLTEWIEGRTKGLMNSSSAKMIGERIYFLIGGQMVLQPQTMPPERRSQLRAALLLATPEKRSKEVYHEVYLQDGTRVTMYNEGLAKRGQDCIVFRKFFVNSYTFEEQAKRYTIPKEAIPLFQNMVAIGYNVAFIGPVRSAKTTFLTTWQSHENPKLEGVMVESDPEIPLHTIMSDAPIMQFVPADDDFPTVIKRIMRSDADYIIMAEARDGIALNTAVKAANKGTKRVKITFHTTDAVDFCYDVADEIAKTYGDDLGSCITKVAKSFHYVFQLMQLPDKSQKRLKAIWEIRYDLRERRVTMHNICRYRYETDDWMWAYTVGSDKEEVGYEENPKAFIAFDALLKDLANRFPYEGDPEYLPSYDHLLRGGLS